MPEDWSEPHPCRRFDVFDPDFHRVAVGVRLPSGRLIIEWLRDLIDEPDPEAPPILQYESRASAEEAIGGCIIMEDPS